MSYLKRFLHEKKGTTAIEYGLIASLIAAAIIASVDDLGSGTDSLWGGVKSEVTSFIGEPKS